MPSIVLRAGRPEHREAVVLGGDLHAPGLQVLDGMVGAAMPEGQLESLQPERSAEQLVPEADAPDGPAADELAHGVDDVVERGGIAGTVGQQHRVGVGGQQLGGRGRAGVERDARAALHEVAHDRALDAGVEHRDTRPRPIAVVADFGGCHKRREVLPVHRGLGRDQRGGLLLCERLREDPAAHRAGIADVADERAGVHAGDRRHAAVREPREPAALGAGRVLAVARLAHDHPACPGAL